jgi:hypothetical protein
VFKVVPFGEQDNHVTSQSLPKNLCKQFEKDKQCEEVLKLVECLTHKNGGKYYSNEMYNEAEQALIKHMRRFKV